MFANLQNKIQLKQLKENKIKPDKNFIFTEGFDIVNQTIEYFEEDKDIINNIVIKEEIIEFENQDLLNYLSETVKQELNYIYNNKRLVEEARELLEDNEEELNAFNENYEIYHKERKMLPSLLEEANEELKTELDKYRMVSLDLEDDVEYDVRSLFDSDLIDKAESENLDTMLTMNWLEKNLNTYTNEINKQLQGENMVMINNNLKKLDINNTEEIKNKIKDVQGSIRWLREKNINEGDKNE